MTVKLRVERFVHSDDPAMTGMRGVRLDATTGYFSGRVFSTSFPTVFVTDAGDIEFSDERVPTSVAAAWFRAVADYLDAAPQLDRPEARAGALLGATSASGS